MKAGCNTLDRAIAHDISMAVKALSYLAVNPNREKSGRFWIDAKHSIFVFVNDNGDDDAWFEMNLTDNFVDTIYSYETEDVTAIDLKKGIEAVVKFLYIYVGG